MNYFRMVLMNSNENVGNSFQIEKFLAARERSIAMVRDCAQKIRPGMSEEQGHQILKDALADHQCERLWHPSKVRFGVNTLKTFREKSEPDTLIQAGDLFFFDIGPVFDGHEGDYGETFVCEKGDSKLADAAQEVYQKSAKAWRESNLTGAALYKYAAECANNLGYELNQDMDGHRLGDFPHALHFKGGLPEHEGVPVPGLWILEIHLRDSKTNRGSFFEDLLQ